jgi:hypothetical protein
MNITQNAVSFIITGTNFNTRAGANLVYLSSGTAKVTAQTSTQLTITFLTQPNLGPLYAVIKNPRKKSAKVRVATVVAGIVVTPNSDYLAINAPTLVIAGTGFSATANENTVTFNLGAAGTVTSATTTELTITLSTQPTSTGSLTAVVAVSTSNGDSGSPVEVANVYYVTFTITDGNSPSTSWDFMEVGVFNGKPFFTSESGFPSVYWDSSQWIMMDGYENPRFSNSTDSEIPPSGEWVDENGIPPVAGSMAYSDIDMNFFGPVTSYVCVTGNSGYNNPSFNGLYYASNNDPSYRKLQAGRQTLENLNPSEDGYTYVFKKNGNYAYLGTTLTSFYTGYYDEYGEDHDDPAPTVTMGEC